MKKHNKKFATRWGSARVFKSAPQLSHGTANSKSVHWNANGLLQRLMRRVQQVLA